ncbi:MAG: transposase [Actinobacteria bacterium]|nr:transposase [Actinomycetota bacterium]
MTVTDRLMALCWHGRSHPRAAVCDCLGTTPTRRPHMPRTARHMPPGATYHLTTRGTNKRAIFDDDADRNRFLRYLGSATQRYAWASLAYCLMGNHVHLVVTGDPDAISAGMRDVLGAHARAYNKRHQRSGHLFGERFHHVVITEHDQMVAALRYVALNPVRAGLVRRPEDWPWSSYTAMVIGKIPSGTLDLGRLAPLFVRPGGRAGDTQRAFRRVVEAGTADAIALAERRPIRARRSGPVTVTRGSG